MHSCFLSSVLVIALGLVVLLATAEADDPALAGASPVPARSFDNPGKAQKATVSPTRLIIRFKPEEEAGLAPATVRMLARPEAVELAPADRERVKPLLDLSVKHGLKNTKHLYFGDRAGDPQIATKLQVELVTRLKTQYPKRAARAVSAKIPDLSRYFVLEFDGTNDIRAVRAEYERNPFVEAAHFDLIVSAQTEPNDPLLHSRSSWGQPEDDLWGLRKINCPKAWETTKGQGVLVAVVDTGLDFDHPDIDGNFWINHLENPNNQMDDDGNGFVDDVRGWDFVNNDNDPTDDNREGHGTHVAGTIAAVGNNNIGVIGVAPEADVMIVKALASNGSMEFSVGAEAIMYAIASGADVVSCSWGPGADFFIPVAIEEVIKFGLTQGVVFVFAAGNDTTVVANQSPMNLREILTVGASTPSDERLSRSNWGRTLDVVAPGGSADAPAPPPASRRSILSLKSKSFITSDASQQLVVADNYVRLSGTSMAAPHVSGVVALILSRRPDLTVEDVQRVIQASADDVHDAGFDLLTGYGRLNAAAAVALAEHKPPTVRLMQPTDNAELAVNGGHVAIHGRVAGDRVAEYELSFCRLDQLEERTLIASGHSEPQGECLAQWDTNDLPPGAYLLRLVAIDADGNRFEDAAQVTKSRSGITRVEPSVDLKEFAIGGRRLAWTQFESAEKDSAVCNVEVLDLKTGEQQRIATTDYGYELAVNSDYLAFMLQPENRNSEIILHAFDFRGRLKPIDSRRAYTFSGLNLSGKTLNWEADNEAFICDGEKGILTRISGFRRIREPRVQGSRAVWVSEDGNIIVCDIRSGATTVITEDGYRSVKRNPQIYNGLVVWTEEDNSHAERGVQIRMYDFRTETIQIIRGGLFEVHGPEISGQYLTWADVRTGNHDIYVYNLATRQESVVATSSDTEGFPKLSGNTVAWKRYIRLADGPDGRYVPVIEYTHLPERGKK